MVVGNGAGYGPADFLTLSREHVRSPACSRCGYIPLATMESLPIALESGDLSRTTPVAGSGTTPVGGLAPLLLIGQVGLGRLTIRMHVGPQQVHDWNEAKMVEMA